MRLIEPPGTMDTGLKDVLAGFVVLGLLGCGGTEESSRARAASLDAEVATFVASYRAAIEARDTPLLRTMYVEDGRFQWIEDGRVRYRSADDVLAGLAGLPVDAVVRTEYGDLDIDQIGEGAATASMNFRTVIGEGSGRYEFGGMISMVLERGASGWRIVSGHTSSARDRP